MNQVLERFLAVMEYWGFTRSFLSAGAPALLVSLWPVSDDATEMLMKQFYSRLANGVGRRDALRDAELAVLADSRFSSPSFGPHSISSGILAR